MTQIFISYARTNEDNAKKIIQALQQRGYDIWYDGFIHGGKHWTKELEQQLRGSSLVLLILTQQSIQSDWVRNEILVAQDEDIPIIPLRFDNFEPLPMWINSYQYIDFVNLDANAAMIRLVQAIGEYIPNSTVSKSKPLVGMPPPANHPANTAGWWRNMSPGERVAAIIGVLSIIATIIAAFIQIAPSFLPSQNGDNATPVVVAASNTPEPPTDVPVVLNTTSETADSNTPLQTEEVVGTEVARIPEETDSPPASPSATMTSSPTPTPTQTLTHTPSPTATPVLDPVLILFPAEESFTIYVAASAPVSLTGLELVVDIDGNRRSIMLTQDFDVLTLLGGTAQPGACFRYLAPNAAVPLPEECSNRQLLFDRRAARSDVFWYDPAGAELRTIQVFINGESLTFNRIPVTCSIERCEIYSLENS